MSRRFHFLSMLLVFPAVLGVLPAAQADRKPHAGMMRYADVSATQIVFVYRERLWLVPREGGTAVTLAAPPGVVSFPRFSPDGQTVAFVGNYDGGTDLYTIPVAGGAPFRVTHHPGGETLCNWTPDGKLLFFAGEYVGDGEQTKLFVVPAAGGPPEQLPVPYGTFGTISPDGAWLAYTPYTRDFATWKRYQGGMASDIWLFNLRDHKSRRITEWPGTDSQPMWQGDKVYYLSDDGPSHRLNIWVYDTKNHKREQITQFSEWDVKWPAIGPGPKGDGEIVFQNGVDLYLLDLKSRQSKVVEISVPGDLPAIRPQRVDVKDSIQSGDISTTGKRAVFEARGDIWTVPAQKGSPRNLTRTSGAAERFPAWSPDNRWIAYLSDQTGEYELYLARADGKGEPRQMTEGGKAYRMNLIWSPDSKRLLFSDKTGALYMYTLPVELMPTEKKEGAEGEPNEPAAPPEGAGELKLIDVDPWASAPMVSWSHDSNWIAYTRNGDNRQPAIWLYSVPTGEKHQVTSSMFNDTWPAFDRKGDYLFFATNRHFAEPIYEDVGSTFVYANTDTLAVVPLREKVGSPWAPKSDEETIAAPKEPKKDGEKDKDKDKGKDKKRDKDQDNKKQPEGDAEQGPAESSPAGEEAEDRPQEAPADAEKPAEKPAEKAKEEQKPIEIELAGFEQRAIRLPVKPGAFTNLTVNSDGKLLYVRRQKPGGPDSASLKIFDLNDEKKEEKTVLDGVGGFGISADGKKILVFKGDTYAIVDAAPDQKLDKPMSLTGMSALINPREEWRQIFNEAWRLQRDYFYDPNMHGVDWLAMREHYGKMLDDCVSRADVSYVIRELISELNVGHAYYWGGNSGGGPSTPTGLLGCDFELVDGAYRIKSVLQGGAWDMDARGPLSQPGVNVKEGDYLLAVNGVPVDAQKDVWAAFVGLAPGRTVTLTVSDKPTLEPTPFVPAEEKKEPEKKDDKKDEKKDDKPELTRTGQRDVLVTLTSPDEDGALRYRAWVERNRAYVEQKTAGKVGYLHVPDTGIRGQNELFRQFYGQVDKAALIIDERWNGGGQLPHRFVELLNRPPTNYWARRDGHDWPSPPDAHQGPKCMLINGAAGSGGDAFPYYFRHAKLGKLIGMRTWGGLVGISGNPGLIDGAVVTVPTFAFYKLNGTWGIEGHGVDPDIEVVDDPALMVDGGDPQLDRAIAEMLEELKTNPYKPPTRPPYPDRSGVGVPPHDR